MRRIVFVLMAVLMAGFMVNSEVEAAGIVITDNLDVDGSVTATSFSGNGSGLTSIPGSALANTSVTASQLANNAVTAGKIAFYGRVAIVANSGGDYSNPATAMTNYASWCPSLSATNPCLLKIMPGVYNVGSSSVVMQQYIDIEGSGEKITKITGTNETGTVLGESNAEIRFITIENTSTGSNTRAIYNAFSKSPSILHVTATASGGNYSQGVFNYTASPTMVHVTATGSGVTYSYGVYNGQYSSPVMTDVTATASGGSEEAFGVYNTSSSPVMTNLTATASGGTKSYGVHNSGGGPVKIHNSVIKGDTNSIYNAYGTTLVSNSQLEGGVYNNSATLTCVGAYDGSFMALGTGCL
jgi:hypothetical protein